MTSHYLEQEQARAIPICPTCGSPAQEVQTRYGLRSQCCGLWSWHRYPLADAATHEARKAAHEAFDKLWKTGIMPRTIAYRRLSAKLGRTAHIKEMTADEARKVPVWAFEIRNEHEGAPL